MAFIHVHIDKQTITLQTPLIGDNIYVDLTHNADSKMKALSGLKKPIKAKSIQEFLKKGVLTW